MKIIDKLNQKGIHISFEVFPPKTDAGFDKVLSATDEIAKLNPMEPVAEQARTQRRSHPILRMISE